MCLARGFAISSEASSTVFRAPNVGFLILSSTLGIIIGDVLWLEALRLLGAKHVIVIDSLKPFMAAILGRVGLGEVLKPPAWGGMLLTVLGVGVVSWEEQQASSSPDKAEEAVNKSDIADTQSTAKMSVNNEGKHSQDGITIQCANDNAEQRASAEKSSDARATKKQNTRGYACAIINVLADSVGSLLTKKFGAGMTTWSINLIRFGFAGIVMMVVSGGMRIHRYRSNSEQLKDKKQRDSIQIDTEATTDETSTTPLWFELPTLSWVGWMQISAGVCFVTFLCPALGNYALFQIALGLAVSLGSIGPLYGLLLDWPFKGKPPTVHGCIGVLLTIAGVVILCVWGTR